MSSIAANLAGRSGEEPASDARPGEMGLPELLAPAGDWDCARAAVENGADAIYFGLEKFNARMRARNFTETDLPSLMEFLHLRGVKGYVTFNTSCSPMKWTRPGNTCAPSSLPEWMPPSCRTWAFAGSFATSPPTSRFMPPHK